MRPLWRTGSGNGYRQYCHGCYNAYTSYAIAVETKGVSNSQVDVDDHVLLGWIVC